MLQELIDEKYLDPLRNINMGGLISTSFDNRETLIEILTKLDEKMATWIKTRKQNKEKVLILKLKNSNNNQSIKLVINLESFYVFGFINKNNEYFHFKEEDLSKIKEEEQKFQIIINNRKELIK